MGEPSRVSGRVLKKETLEKMYTIQFPKKDEKFGFGLGFFVSDIDGKRVIRHGGAVYGFAVGIGFSIEEIRALLALAEPERGSCAEVKEIAGAHLLEVRKKLTDLARLEAILSQTIARCSGKAAPACPVLDMLGKPLPALAER